MPLIRPEARATLHRFREALAGGATLLLGLWWLLGTAGLLPYIGGAVAIAGAALLLAGLQRARFRGGAGGPGVVQVDEGQIAYFGPLTGGAVALSEISSLSLDPTAKPPHWVLSQPGQPDLFIPLNAEGADTLFDVFASLPGIRTERMLAQMRAKATAPVLVWQRPDNTRARLARLH